MGKNEKIAIWNLQVPRPLDEAVEKAILSNFHLTKSEFIRDAVRKRLEEIGINPPHHQRR